MRKHERRGAGAQFVFGGFYCPAQWSKPLSSERVTPSPPAWLQSSGVVLASGSFATACKPLEIPYDSSAYVRLTKRKCMGIEPTGCTFSVQPNGFEDRGRHQPCTHFRSARGGKPERTFFPRRGPLGHAVRTLKRRRTAIRKVTNYYSEDCLLWHGPSLAAVRRSGGEFFSAGRMGSQPREERGSRGRRLLAGDSPRNGRYCSCMVPRAMRTWTQPGRNSGKL